MAHVTVQQLIFRNLDYAWGKYEVTGSGIDKSLAFDSVLCVWCRRSCIIWMNLSNPFEVIFVALGAIAKARDQQCRMPSEPIDLGFWIDKSVQSALSNLKS